MKYPIVFRTVLVTAFLSLAFASEAKDPPPKKAAAAAGQKAGKVSRKIDPLAEKVDILRSDVDLLRQTVDDMQKKIDELNLRLNELNKPKTQAELEEEIFNSIPSVTPEYVRLITNSMAKANAGNPVWSSSPGELAYEESTEKSREIIIAKSNGSIVKKLAYAAKEEDALLDDLLSGTADRVSYNAGITFGPTGDEYIYMSNGGEGNYDLYQGALYSPDIARLTEESEKDGHANWSPKGNSLVFVSGRDGNAQLYVMDTYSRKTYPITKLPKGFFYPVWSPNGNDILVTYGDNDNHDIVILKNVSSGTPEMVAITNWEFDDLRPRWSPDGKKIAFYTNYSEKPTDDTKWSLVVVDVEKPKLLSKGKLIDNIVATNVVPQIESGPAWLPDSRNIVYVKKDERIYNPLFVVDTESQKSHLIRTKTRINNDVSCSPDGLIAFRAQENQWDRIFITKLPTVIQ